MKSIALAILAATVSAGLTDVLNFEFEDYFTRVESRPSKPALGSYTYEFEEYPWQNDVGYRVVSSVDFNIEYTTPFKNNLERTFYTISFLPEINLGG